MSVRVMTWVWDHSRSKKTDRLVLLAIADCCSDDGSNAYPSMSELVRKTGLTDRGVQKSISRLVELGELFVGRNGGPKGCNRYRVIMHTPEQDSPPNAVHPERGSGVRTVDTAQVNAATPNTVHPPEHSSPPPNAVRVTPERRSPGTVLEPSDKNSSSKSSSRTRGSRLPDDFGITRQMREWAAGEIPGFDIDREHMRFRDYWRAAPGQRGVKADWPATWRNWMRKAADETRTRATSRRPHQPFTNPTDAADAYGGTL